MLLKVRNMLRSHSRYLWLGGLLAICVWVNLYHPLVTELLSDQPWEPTRAGLLEAVPRTGHPVPVEKLEEPKSPLALQHPPGNRFNPFGHELDHESVSATAEEATEPPEVPRFEPTVVEHVPALPPALLKKVTVKWDEISFEEAIQELDELVDLPIKLFDLPDEKLSKITITYHLNNQPLYLLLDRLNRHQITWFIEHGQLVFSLAYSIHDHHETRVYDVGPLLAGDTQSERSEKIQELTDALMLTSGTKWLENDGQGGTVAHLGNALVVRHDLSSLRYTEAFLAAMKSEERFVLVNPAPGELALWQTLNQPLDVDFNETPLSQACEQLAQLTGVDIRLHESAFKDLNLSPDVKINWQAHNCTLAEAIPRIYSEHIEPPLSYIIQDGVLWITTLLEAEEVVSTTIFQVPELCLLSEESEALIETLLNTTSGPWMDCDGVGGEIRYISPGKIVVKGTLDDIREIQTLLQNVYDVRWNAADQPLWSASDSMVVKYYRLEADMAESVLDRIKRLGPEGSWASPENPTGGDISLWRSESQLRSAPHSSGLSGDKAGSTTFTTSVAVPMAVLEIRQTPRMHQQIQELLQNLKHGNERSDMYYHGVGIF